MTQGNIYLDFNATTPVADEVKAGLMEWVELWGNPSSIHNDGRGPKRLMRESRRQLAQSLGCHPLELIFTSGGSEANNTAIQGCLRALLGSGSPRRRVFLGAIEHPSVLKQRQEIERLGFEVVIIPVNREGHYDLEFLEQEMDERVALVSVMWANNEVGVISPLREIAELTHRFGGYIHSDMVQVLGKMAFSLDKIPVDIASFSSHKIYALKGSGLLYVKKRTPMEPLLLGGAQERGRRAGTENLLAIASLAKMVSTLDAATLYQELKSKRDDLETEISKRISGVEFLARGTLRIPNTSSLVIAGVSGETLLMNLDIRGFSVGTGAACSSGNPEPSPVLLAMGLSRDEAQSSLRISIGRTTSRKDLQSFVDTLVEVVTHLRELSASGEKNDGKNF